MRRILFFLLGMYSQTMLAEPVLEYEMKATFLYNFAVFTEWPPSSDESFNLCVLGQDNFGPALKKIEGKVVNGKRIAIARLSSLSAIKKCQLLFVAERETGNFPAILKELGDAPVLTVSDVPSTSPTIVLALNGQRLVFDINLQKARSAHLTLSSKLLQLARSVQQ